MSPHLLVFNAHVLSYWVFSLMFSVMDLYWFYTGQLNNYKLVSEKRKLPSVKMITAAVGMSLINQAMTYPIIAYLVPFCISGSTPLTSLCVLVFYTLLADQWFYWTHRIMHYPLLYRNIHTIHHQWTYPIAVCTVYSHPLEHIICNLGALVIGPLIFPISIEAIILWTVITTYNAVTAHCGMNISLFGAEKHDIHHRYLNCNYGALGISDKMYGTYRTINEH